MWNSAKFPKYFAKINKNQGDLLRDILEAPAETTTSLENVTQ